jgi:RHS repeat-associated protein
MGVPHFSRFLRSGPRDSRHLCLGDSNRTQNFDYDNLNRIAHAYTSGPNWGEAFTIDAWGNLTNRAQYLNKTQYEGLNAAPATTKNQLTGYTYDAAGNTSLTGSSYDAENRLATAGGVTYTYDGDGKRVMKSGGTLYWGAGPLAESDLMGSAASWKEYIFFEGKRVARRDAVDSSVHYFFSDHLGSTSVITNNAGTTFEEDLDYFPYGGIASGSSSDHYLFTGKERDTESGLDNFGARYNASSLGRFMTPDPKVVSRLRMVDPQQWNMYAYTRNNPLTYVDPDGKELTLAIYYQGVSEAVAGRAAGLMAAKFRDAGVKNVTYQLHAGQPSTATTLGQIVPGHTHVLEFRNGTDAPNSAGQSITQGFAGQNFGKGNSAVDVTSVQSRTGNDAQLAQGLANEGAHEVSHDAINPFYHLTHPDATDLENPTGAGDPNWLKNPNLNFSGDVDAALQNTFNRSGEVDTTPPSPPSPPPPPCATGKTNCSK